MRLTQFANIGHIADTDEAGLPLFPETFVV
ncbi:hypothetical protein SAMN05428949_5896 [Chitinophaga sp. YR627]|nr:hypothetical protein SAMN05428949_5896 [Chitinophaga sp. YR627]